MIRTLAFVLIVVAESLVAYAAAEWLNAGFDSPQAPTWFTFVLIGLIALALPRVLDIVVANARLAMLATLAVAWVVLYGAIRIEFASDFALWDLAWVGDFLSDADTTLERGGPPTVGGLLLIGTWARATWRSNADIELDTVPRGMAIPFLIGTIVLVFAAASDRSGETARAVMAFYAVALSALALSQLALSGATAGDLRAGGTTATLLGGTAAVTVLGVLVFGPVFSLTLDGASALIDGPVGDGIGAVAVAILTPPLWLVNEIFSWLFDFGSGEQEMVQTPEALGNGEGVPGEPLPEENDGSTFSRVLGYILRGTTLGLIVIGIGVGFFFLLRLNRRRLGEDGVAAQVESSGSILGDLRGAARNLFRRGPAQPQAASPAVRLYVELLHEAESGGVVRTPGQTPEDIEPEVARTVPTAPAHEITVAFEDARYGGREPAPDDIEALRKRWRREGS